MTKDTMKNVQTFNYQQLPRKILRIHWANKISNRSTIGLEQSKYQRKTKLGEKKNAMA